MGRIRFPIAGLMGVVLIAAIGLAAVRNASETWAGATFLMTCGVLCLSIVGAICREGADRAWWLGFALFGWGYLALAFWSPVDLPTMPLLDAIASRLGLTIQFGGAMGGMGGGLRSIGVCMFGGFGGIAVLTGTAAALPQIAHCLWALAFALIGGLLARALFGRASRPVERAEVEASAPIPIQNPRRWWLWPSAMGIAGCILIVVSVVIASKSASEFWVGATFLATCGLLGLTILGVAGDRGLRRQIWLGAAIFGVSYMTMAFGRSLDQETWPGLPSDYLLHAVRRSFPPIISGYSTSSDGINSGNSRIWAALQKPIPMRFAEETPLEDVLKHIQAKTADPTGKGIPIYLDPIGLQEAERSPTSMVAINLDGVALKTTLHLLLKQLGLTYSIRDGLLLITSEESEAKPVYQDPFMIVGHCVLALLAAGFGGMAALFFRLKPIAHAAP